MPSMSSAKLHRRLAFQNGLSTMSSSSEAPSESMRADFHVPSSPISVFNRDRLYIHRPEYEALLQECQIGRPIVEQRQCLYDRATEIVSVNEVSCGIVYADSTHAAH